MKDQTKKVILRCAICGQKVDNTGGWKDGEWSCPACRGKETLTEEESQILDDNILFHKIVSEAIELHDNKNRQYHGAWRENGVSGLIDNIDRKIARYNAIKTSGSEGESLRDTLLDTAIYCLMTIQLMDECGVEELHPCPFCGHLKER